MRLRRSYRALAIALFLLCCVSSLQATNRYISTTGTNNATCTSIGSPCATFAYALPFVVAGDTLYACAAACDGAGTGTFSEGVEPFTHSGTDMTTGAVTVKAYPGETVSSIGASSGIGLGGTAGSPLQYVIIDGISVVGTTQIGRSTVTIENANHILVKNGDYSNGGVGNGLIYISEGGGNGSVCGISNITILNNIIHDANSASTPNPNGGGSHGVYVSGGVSIPSATPCFGNDLQILIDGNTFSGMDDPGKSNAAIEIYSQVGTNALNGVTVRNNIAHDNTECIYASASGTTGGQKIYNNICYNNTYGLELGSTTVANTQYIYHNVFYNQNTCVQVGSFSPSVGGVFKNNVCSATSSEAYHVSSHTSGSTNQFIAQYNDFFGGTGVDVPALSTVSLNIGGASGIDPSFVSTSGHDFHLNPGSPMIDVGLDLTSVVATDFDGVTRAYGVAVDVGPYEFNQSSGGGGTGSNYTRVQVTSDNFTTGSTTCLSAYGPYTDIYDGGATNCVKVDAANDVIYGNTSTSGFNALVSRSTGTFNDNQYSSLKITAMPADASNGTQVVGVGVRIGATTGASRSGYFMGVYKDTSTGQYTDLYKIVAGVKSTIASITSTTWAVNDLIELEVFGTQLKVLKSGTEIVALTTIDTDLSTGKPGVAMVGGTGSVATGDNLLAGNLVSGNTYYVCTTTGNDANTGLTIGQCLATINHALSLMAKGDVLNMCAAACDGAGSASFAVTINDVTQAPPSGDNPSNAPVIKNYPGETVTLALPASCSTLSLIAAHDVVFQGFTINAASVTGCTTPDTITYDTTGNDVTYLDDPLTFSVAPAVQSNRLLLGVFSSVLLSGTASTLASAPTFNSVSTTSTKSDTSTATFGMTLTTHRLVAPATGSHTYSADETGSASYNLAAAIVLYNVDQTTPVRTAGTSDILNDGTGTSSATCTATTVPGDMVVSILMTPATGSSPGSMTAGAGQTVRVNGITAGNNNWVWISTKIATTTSTTSTFTWTGLYDKIFQCIPVVPTSTSGTADAISIGPSSTGIIFSGVTVTNSPASIALVSGSGFKFLNGAGTSNNGGFTMSAAGTIDGNTFSATTGTLFNISASNVSITRNTITSGTTHVANVTGSYDSTVFNNNVVYSNAGTGFRQVTATPTNTTIYNNTFYLNDRGINVTAGGGTTLAKNNIAYLDTTNDITCTSCTVATNQVLNPSFVSAPSNLRLAAGSTAVDVGTTIAAVPTDRDGNARPSGSAYDIGAYEATSRAVVVSVTPAFIRQAQATTYTLVGSGFSLGSASVVIGGSVATPSVVSVVDDNTITLTITAASGATVGATTITVDTTAGVGTSGAQFSVTPVGGPYYYRTIQ